MGGHHGIVVHEERAPVAIAARFATSAKAFAERDDLLVFVVGKVDNVGALANVLDVRGRRDADAVAAAYLEFGVDAFARIFGHYACVVWDARERQLVLARSSGVGGGPALHYHRDGKRTMFATRLVNVPANALARDDLTTWVRRGRWPAPERGPFEDVEVVPPGHAVVVKANGRTDRRRIWTYSPLVVPRELSAEAARRELDLIIEGELASIGAAAHLVGEQALTTFFAHRLGTRRFRQHHTFATTDADAILRAARHVELPVPLSKLLTLAKLLRDPGVDLVLDWGAREAMGGTSRAMRAWVRSIARAIDGSPRPKTLVQVARLAWPVDRRLGTPRLHRDVLDVGANVARRWTRQFPGTVSRRVEKLLGPPPSLDHDAPDPVTGDPFVDLRFAEATDASLAAAHTALRRLAGTNDRQALAPFLSAEVVEFLFSIPARYFVRDRQTMWLLDGGVPVEPPPISPPPEALALRLDDWLDAATKALQTKVPTPIALGEQDRWLGLAAFLESRRGSSW